MAKVKSGSVKVGDKVGNVVKPAARKASSVAQTAADKAEDRIKHAGGPSPNPMTNLVIADLALRGGGRLLRHFVERTLLGVKYPPDKARNIVKGRSMTQSLLGAALARVATRSVPGALLVGGGLIAKTLYDRSRSRKVRAEGEEAVDEQARKA